MMKQKLDMNDVKSIIWSASQNRRPAHPVRNLFLPLPMYVYGYLFGLAFLYLDLLSDERTIGAASSVTRLISMRSVIIHVCLFLLSSFLYARACTLFAMM